ncbi:NACHT, LRR and PYD domains-containing protein 1a [Holothuria leucospilota]|uniref:NACHT, LRR and PYD domains-containing protein 1a n=1 Tax=Holothuria leucospilota TaxID=206669 RepID=A0A9Q1HKM1_HOLLE|nr:NACHT, LRR and PYD domains-containing protein 1a [Holothuria leucospilota]
MMARLAVFPVCVVVFMTFVFESRCATECNTPQYLQLGTTGTVECTFPNIFFGVFWYNSNDSNATPILYFKDSTRSGRGYTSGEFNVYPNGSLIINNVSLEHDRIFKVVIFRSTSDSGDSFNIRVIATAVPSDFPIIDGCILGNVCLKQYYPPLVLACRAENARPAVKLTWLSRTVFGDRQISYETEVLQQKELFTTFSNLTVEHSTPNASSIYNLYVCKADIPMKFLQSRERKVLIENRFDGNLAAEPVVKFVKYKSSVELVCTNTSALYTVWKRKISNDYFKNILVTLSEDVPRVTTFSDLFMASGKNLFVQEVDFDNEGFYFCVYDDGGLEKIRAFQLNAYVLPDPPYVLVEGCNLYQYCVLSIQQQGFLTCSLTRVRPRIELEWKILATTPPSKLEFTNHKMTFDEVDESSNIILKSHFTIRDTSPSRITIECRVKENSIEEYRLSTKLDLLYLTDGTSDGNSVSSPSVGVIVILATILPVTLAIVIIALLFYRRAKSEKRKSSQHEEVEDETMPMMKKKAGRRKTPGNNYDAEKCRHFKKQLQAKYLQMCKQFHPIPYMGNKSYNINEVFVEGGIARKEGQKWKQLLSYREILEEKSSFSIIEGDPGYGKSTVSCHLAFEWCENKSLDIEILILLRLRYLKQGVSISTAVKEFLLDKNDLSEEDIDHVLDGCPSVTFLLDGFDKYPGLKDYEHSIINEILAKKKFEKASIILTTRISCLPLNVPKDASYFYLTGFTEQMQESYFENVVFKGKNGRSLNDTLKERLHYNTVLSALCEVPLFFVLFAHMSSDDNIQMETQFTTATNFFANVIEGFHQHVHIHDGMDIQKECNDDGIHANAEKLEKLAFNGLAENYQQMFWEEEDVKNQLSEDLYNHYVDMGILVKDFATVNDKIYATKVRFYHNTFCEWYAACYLSRNVQCKTVNEAREMLRKFNPNYLQYVFQFASGLSKEACLNIIQYLKGNIRYGERFSILCAQEQPDMKNELLNFIWDVCKAPLTIDKHDTKLLQRSTIRILSYASEQKVIDIDVLWLCGMDVTFNSSDNVLQLSSGLTLPTLQTLKQLSITNEDEITQDEFIQIASFASQCERLKTLRFRNKILPEKVPLNKLPADLKERNVSVEWHTSKKEKWQKLDLTSGVWVWEDLTEDLQEFLGIRMKNMTRKEIREHVKIFCESSVNFTSEVQQSKIDLVTFASSQKIDIECVYLRDVYAIFDKSREEGLKFRSGMLLPYLKTLNQLSITDKGREFTKEDMNGLLHYCSSCSSLKTLRFRECLLPETMCGLPEWEAFQKRDVKVHWKVDVPQKGGSYDLNTITGKWMYNRTEISPEDYLYLKTHILSEADTDVIPDDHPQ